MKPTEQAAREWLERQGVSGLVFQINQSPDFLSSDGRGWEVKRLAWRSVFFTVAQVIALRKHGRTTVLIFRDGESEPLVTVPFGELDLLGEYEGINLRVNDDRPHVGNQPIKSRTRLAEIVERGLTVEPQRHRMVSTGECSCGWVYPVAFGRLRQIDLPLPAETQAAA